MSRVWSLCIIKPCTRPRRESACHWLEVANFSRRPVASRSPQNVRTTLSFWGLRPSTLFRNPFKSFIIIMQWILDLKTFLSFQMWIRYLPVKYKLIMIWQLNSWTSAWLGRQGPGHCRQCTLSARRLQCCRLLHQGLQARGHWHSGLQVVARPGQTLTNISLVKY